METVKRNGETKRNETKKKLQNETGETTPNHTFPCFVTADGFVSPFRSGFYSLLTFHLERSSFLYLLALMVTTHGNASLPVFCTQLHQTQTQLLLWKRSHNPRKLHIYLDKVMQCGLVYYSSFGTGAWTINTLLLCCCTEVENGWFSWGVASLPEGKSWGLWLAQLCVNCRLLNAMLSPYH